MHAASIASHGRTGKVCARGIASFGRLLCLAALAVDEFIKIVSVGIAEYIGQNAVVRDSAE